MSIGEGLFSVAVLVYLWYLVRMVRRVRKQERAKALLEDVRDLRERDVWHARLKLHEAYDACYDAGMIEQYQDLHEWFYGRKG